MRNDVAAKSSQLTTAHLAHTSKFLEFMSAFGKTNNIYLPWDRYHTPKKRITSTVVGSYVRVNHRDLLDHGSTSSLWGECPFENTMS